MLTIAIKIDRLKYETAITKMVLSSILPLVLMLLVVGCSSPEKKAFNTILTHYDMVMGGEDISVEQIHLVEEEVTNFMAMYPNGSYALQVQEMADRLSTRESELRFQKLKKRIEKLMALDGAEYLEVLKDGWSLLNELKEFSSMPDYPDLEIELKAKLGSGR